MVGLRSETKEATASGVRWNRSQPARSAGAERAGVGSYANDMLKPKGMVVDIRNCCSLAFNSTRTDMSKAVQVEKKWLKNSTFTTSLGSSGTDPLRPDWGHAPLPQVLCGSDCVVALGYAFTSYPKIYP